MMNTAESSWESVAAAKRLERDEKIPPAWRIPNELLPAKDVKSVVRWPAESGFFTEHELMITSMTATALVEDIASRKLTSLEVTEAFCKRTSVAQQLINCVTEICFEDAYARAKHLDSILAETGKTIGPLHGLPISLKDQFDIRGLDSTLGYVSSIGRPAARNATLVELLLAAGAVIYVKTNVPQTLMLGETVNNVFGRTVNPINRNLTAGGSSGGEGALLGFWGSPLGVGTDIAGSIRHPSNFNGLWGLRPSNGRVSYQYVTNTFVGQEAIRSSAGPMGHSPADLHLFMEAVVGQEGWKVDPLVLPIPWRTAEVEAVRKRKLVFGYATHDTLVSVTPPYRRAILLVKEKLEKLGHTVVEFIPKEMVRAEELAIKLFSADGGLDFATSIEASDEPYIPEVLADWGPLLPKAQRPTVSDIWKVQKEREELGAQWYEHWNQAGIDVLIMPCVAYPAKPHGGSDTHLYSWLAPLLDLTVATFPVTVVHGELDVYPSDYTALSEKDKVVMDWYQSPSRFEDAPIGLTVTARRLEEEKVVAILELLEDVLHTSIQ
ncbi:amidase [Cylindrobasidium torrendii FP15055 ss-10]|uniref:amidase n=1 Tax=Cylindrobasidium torrendii FP15055 ss-10 TaxID=1314674 RepID=A0A0D7B331_9AGAR|nr:amidase [Cylindrobasidium torrendii FP15055 ss-10]